jgi:hypothetical protein
MNPNFKPNERELITIAGYFKRQSKKLIQEGKLGEENKQVEEAVDRFVEQMGEHADNRSYILEQRKQLGKLVKDNAECPRCHTKDMIKVVGIETNEKGWKSNRYKCRKCNIQFTWNRPNNPWHMIAFIEEVLTTLRLKVADVSTPASEKEEIDQVIDSMQANLDKLKPVIEAHDIQYNSLTEQDEAMEKAIHEFKNTLLIAKIKMDTWENKKK